MAFPSRCLLRENSLASSAHQALLPPLFLLVHPGLLFSGLFFSASDLCSSLLPTRAPCSLLFHQDVEFHAAVYTHLHRLFVVGLEPVPQTLVHCPRLRSVSVAVHSSGDGSTSGYSVTRSGGFIVRVIDLGLVVTLTKWVTTLTESMTPRVPLHPPVGQWSLSRMNPHLLSIDLRPYLEPLCG